MADSTCSATTCLAATALAGAAAAYRALSTGVEAATAAKAQRAMSRDWGLLEKFLERGKRTAAQPLKPRPKICDTALDAIGHTPLVRLQKIPKLHGVPCEILAKCEFFNAGGSVKDRIGKRMVLDAEARGEIKPGDTLIEPTSGNTGIGIALAGAVRGYKVIITLPQKMSSEKVNVLKALGATIIRTPTEAAHDSPESHIMVAKDIRNKINAQAREAGSTRDTAHILDQYSNPSNPLAHYDGTAEELLQQCDGKIDMVVMGAGTGGTMTGLARKLKEKLPEIKVVAVDPDGSLLAKGEAGGEKIKSYHVEGIGYDFVPDVCDRGIVDDWVKSFDQESFDLARDMIRKEGLLCGGSCGSALAGALKAVRGETLNHEITPLVKGQRCVVILPDSTRNYMTKFLTDEWMQGHGFMATPAASAAATDNTVGALIRKLKLKKPTSCDASTMIKDAVQIMVNHGYDQLPVLRGGHLMGMVTMGNCSKKVGRVYQAGVVQPTDPVEKICIRFQGARKKFSPITADTDLDTLDDFFDKNYCAFVGSASHIEAVITRVDIVQYKLLSTTTTAGSS